MIGAIIGIIVLLLPGYLFTRMLFEDLDVLETSLYTLVFSMVCMVFFGLFLGLFHQINTLNLYMCYSIVIILSIFWIIFQKQQLF